MRLQPKTYNPQPQPGFTLIEAIVATALFAFVVSAILGVYVLTLQLDHKTRAERAVLNNGSFIMQFLAKEVRNGSINYASYAGGTIPVNPSLFVENQGNELEQFSYSSPNIVLTKNSASSNLNSADVKVTNLKFLISPAQDPYTATSAANGLNEQPHVTVILELTSNYGSKPSEVAKVNLESTFSTRTYPSRQ